MSTYQSLEPVYPGGPTRFFQEEGAGKPVSGGYAVRKTQPAIDGFEDEGRGPRIKECGCLQKLEKARKGTVL